MSMVNPPKSWPRALEEWVAWVARPFSYFRGHWASFRIEQFIGLTNVNTFIDKELMSAVLKF